MRLKIMRFFLIGMLGMTLFTGDVLAKEKPYEGVTLRIPLAKFNECYFFVDAAKEAAKELGVKIEVSWYERGALHDKLLIDYRTNNPVWDIVMVDSMWRGEWVETGLIIPFEEYVNDHPELIDPDLLALDDLDPFYGVPSWTYEGKLVAFPLYTIQQALFYRKDLFDNSIEKRKFKEKYGYELQPPKTYKQYYDIAEFFTRKKGEMLAGKVLEYDFYGLTHSNKQGNFLWNDFMCYAAAFGADQVYDPKTMRPTFNSPEMVEAAEYYLSLNPFLPPGHINMTSGEATSYTAKGYVAMQMEWVIRCTSMLLNPELSEVSDKIDYIVFPSREGVPGREHAMNLGGTAVGISSISKNKEAAYKLIEKAMSKEIQKKGLFEEKWSGGGHLPPRMSVLTDPEVQKQFPYLKKMLDKLYRSDIYLFPYPTLVEYQECLDVCTAELSMMLTEIKSPKQACDDAQEKLIEIFKRAGYIE